jgi:hypothetical protein
VPPQANGFVVFLSVGAALSKIWWETEDMAGSRAHASKGYYLLLPMVEMMSLCTLVRRLLHLAGSLYVLPGEEPVWCAVVVPSLQACYPRMYYS